jgi:hypothetical protein
VFEQVRATHTPEDGSVIGQAAHADVGEHVEPAELSRLLTEAGQHALAGAR